MPMTRNHKNLQNNKKKQNITHDEFNLFEIIKLQ
jgi:hypothetical protein